MTYIQQRHMIYGEMHKHNYLVLYQNTSDTYYLSPLLHEVWNVDHKMGMLKIVFCYKTFYIFVCNISIILNMILSACPFSFTGSFPLFSLINDSMFTILLRHMFWEWLIQTVIIFLCRNSLEYVNQNIYHES